MTSTSSAPHSSLALHSRSPLGTSLDSASPSHFNSAYQFLLEVPDAVLKQRISLGLGDLVAERPNLLAQHLKLLRVLGIGLLVELRELGQLVVQRLPQRASLFSQHVVAPIRFLRPVLKHLL